MARTALSDVRRRVVVEAEPQPRRRTPRLLVIALVVVVLVVVAGAAVVVTRNPTPTKAARPLAYHVTYRVTAHSVVTTEELWVRRPFESRQVIYAGRTTHTTPISTIVTRLGRQYVRNGDERATVLEVAPRPASFDINVASVSALKTIGFERRAGRSCRIYRSRQRLVGAPLRDKPTAADHVDTCVDQGGIVLEEIVVERGERTIERRAIRIDRARGDYAITGEHIPLKQGGGRVVTVTNSSRPPATAFWNLARPPHGFNHVGRFAVVLPHPKVNNTEPNVVTEMADVFVRGPDVIVVEQGQSLLGGGLPGAEGEAVDLGALGKGHLSLSALASSTTTYPSRSTFVRVTATLSPRELVRVSRSLVKQRPGRIVRAREIAKDR